MKMTDLFPGGVDHGIAFRIQKAVESSLLKSSQTVIKLIAGIPCRAERFLSLRSEIIMFSSSFSMGLSIFKRSRMVPLDRDGYFAIGRNKTELILVLDQCKPVIEFALNMERRLKGCPGSCNKHALMFSACFLECENAIPPA